jgi:hypothetical protein
VEGPAVPSIPIIYVEWKRHPPLCHPERTRISYYASLNRAAYVVLREENHMRLTEVATLDRKSGEAEGSAVPRTLLGNVFAVPAEDPRSVYAASRSRSALTRSCAIRICLCCRNKISRSGKGKSSLASAFS